MPARKRSAFVLLVVLGVIILVITVLGLFAKVSLRRGVQSVDAQRALQQRWGAMTMQRVLMNRASNIFEARDELLKKTAQIGDPPPPPYIRSALTLGDVTFDLMVGDEDAKLNLNALYHHGGSGKLEQALQDVVPMAGLRALLPRPVVKPLLMEQGPPASNARRTRNSDSEPTGDDKEEGKPQIPAAFRSWGEVFDLAGLSKYAGSEVALPNLTTDMTCWGSGQLNVRRASDASILAVFGSVIQDGGATLFLKKYRENPTSDLNVLLLTEVDSERQREKLSRMVSETSTNFSLWIDASTKSGRPLREFVVGRRDEEGVTRIEKFAH